MKLSVVFALLEKVTRRVYALKNIPILFSYFRHNRKLFRGAQKNMAAAPIVLMELNALHSAHISYAYLANELAHETGAQIKAYAPKAHSSWPQRLRFYLKSVVGWAEFGTYRSFGVNEFIEIRLNDDQHQRAKELYVDVLNRIHNTHDIEDLHIHGAWIGDLVYDTFLMTYREPTIDISSPIFHDFMLESVQLFVFWEDYLTKNDVRGINVSHCVYNLAIPLRIAVERGIAGFQANVTHVYRLNKGNLFAYNDFFYFREQFAELPADVREAGIALAEHRIQRRFAGEIGVDMTYSTKSAYGEARHQRLLRKTPHKKILIATHCFFDSPHSYGKNTFPDFYEWLDFLGKMTEQTDYDWYIKTHPDYLPGTKEIIDSFVATYPKLTLLPADASHHQIIAEGIDLALTAYGTIGFEYAALGIPVINASLNNPHIAYDFNIHAEDPDHYRQMLLDIDNLDFRIDKQQVYEYYFMRHIYNTENIFFESYERAIEDIGGYSAQFTPLAYKKWLAEWSPRRHEEIVKGLHDFVCSGQFRMDHSFYGHKFSVASLGDKQ